MTQFKVYQQVEGEAGLTCIGTVPNDATAEQVEQLLGIPADRKLYTVIRKIDEELAWLVRIKSTNVQVRTKHQRFEDLATICAFLGWAERDQPKLAFGGHQVGQVLEAWCRVSGMKREQIDRVLDDVPEETQQ